MKNKKRISLIIVSLVCTLLFPTMVSAALPPTVEPQWANTNTVVCGIVVTSEGATARASITGKNGTYVEATATLYKIKDDVPTIIYTASTPENNPMPFASFTYEFAPESGATYFLVLRGTVSKNGVEDVIEESDTAAFP